MIGTGPIARVVVVKDSQVADALRAGQKEFETAWTDPKPSAGTHYYYVRVEQQDGEPPDNCRRQPGRATARKCCKPGPRSIAARRGADTQAVW